ncbi:MAG: carbohydrate ABC transporter permease [Oscillospiraceae bacterium]
MTYSQKKFLGKAANHVVVILLGLVMIYPVVWLIAASFKDTSEIVTQSYRILPVEFTWKNYPTGWKGFGNITFATFFKNSLVISSLSTFGTTLSSAIVAYGFTRVKFPGRKIWFSCMMMTMMLPSQVILIPQYIIFQKINWVNTYNPLVVPAFFGQAFFIFMIMQFIQGLPRELDEAATIDGCNRFSIFARIILPLVVPALITTVIISFYWKWDEFLQPLIYLSRPEKYPISLALKSFVDSTSQTDYGALFAMSTLSLLPVFLIFLFFNSYLLEGISTSGLKG